MGKSQVNILIVDDEEGITDFMNKILKKEGYCSFTAFNYVEAKSVLDNNKIDIALLDVQLSESQYNGIDLLKSIKAKTPECHCIMITRVTDAETVSKAKEYKASAFLQKPLVKEDWLSVVDEFANKVRGI